MKKLSFVTLLVALLLCLAIPFASCGNNDTTEVEGYSYVTIDVNPSVELVVDGETVISVNAVNDDALILLAGEAIEGMQIEKAAEKIVSLCEELGYLTEENNNVKLTVTADTDQIIEKIEEFVEKGAKKGSLKAIINKIPRNADQRKVEELKEECIEKFENLTAQKLRLIESIMELSEDMTYEIGAEMNVSELVNLLKELVAEKPYKIGKEVREQMEARFKELKEEAKKRVAEIYGDEFFEKWNDHKELEKIFEEIEKKAENIEISEEDINAILEILNLEAIDKIAIDGKVTVESVEKYIDKCFANEELFSTIRKINDILEKYDAEEYILNEEELEKIKDFLGEFEIEKLDDLEDFVEKNEEIVESFKEEIELSKLEKEFVDIIEKGYEQMKDQVDKEFETIIDKASKEFERIKTEKKNRKY